MRLAFRLLRAVMLATSGMLLHDSIRVLVSVLCMPAAEPSVVRRKHVTS
jgi:hypothetical protein